MSEHLILKWGTLKGCELETQASKAALQKYAQSGDVSSSAMSQRDNDQQRAALCELIDTLDGEVINDWSGEVMTKEAAKKYVMEYGRHA